MSANDKPLAWLHGEVKTPPFSPEAKKTSRTPKQVIDTCKARIKDYDNATK
jgi:hypothetical protein